MPTEPVNPTAIAALPGVEHSFQADRDFQAIDVTSEQAKELYEISPICLKTTSRIMAAAGLGTLYRFQASSDSSHFMLMSLNPDTPAAPGPRLFGLQTNHSTDIDYISGEITALL